MNISNLGMKVSSPDTSETSQNKEYVKKQKRILGPLLALLLFLPLYPALFFGAVYPVVSILSSFAIASLLLFFFSFLQVRIERKYRRVSATQKDYFVSDLPLYVVGIVPGLFVLGFDYMIPKFGLVTILYVDAIVVALVLVLARFPLALRVGQRASKITDEDLLSSFNELARQMGIENVSIYTVDWKRFKVANAFQTGPRKFSVYFSNYLLENMSHEEVKAVMAHELAHAKKRHVAKSIALFIFPLLVELNLLIFGAMEMQTTIFPGVIPFAVGVVSIFLTPRIALRFQRGFELDADASAARTLGDRSALISALQKLAKLNLIPSSKDSATHPSMIKRIQRIERLQIES